MISRHKIKFKDGSTKINVRVVEGYRPGPGKNPKQRQIKNFGYIEDQTDINKFWEEVNKCNDELKYKKKKISVDLDPTKTFKDLKWFSLGEKYIEPIYNFLELDDFFNKIKTKCKYDIGELFKYLVLQRIVNPNSRRAIYQTKNTRYQSYVDFEYHQLIRSLTKFDINGEEIQNHINKIITKKVGRNYDYIFYDTTNFYFEKDYSIPNTLPQKGVSKEHVTNPIVQYGLAMDSNYIPIRFNIFQGNVSDTKTYLPTIKDLKEKLGYERIISVADKGMNSESNISYLYFNGDGYVFSQILKGKKGKRYHDKMFEDDKFIYNEDKTYKYRIFEEDFTYKKKDDKGKIIETVTKKRKVLIYWKKSIEDRERNKRANKILLAEKAIKNNAYSLTHDVTKYIKTTHFEKDTGLIADKNIKGLDNNKIQLDEKFDGYFCIVTSELSFDNNQIHSVYNQLSKIEECFRISKSSLNLRPAFVWTDSHIYSHVLICFVALIIERLLELKMKENFTSINRIQNALYSIGCEEISKGIMHISLHVPKNEYIKKIDEKNNEYYSLKLSDDNEVVNDIINIQKMYNSKFDYINVRQEDLNKHLKGLKFAITK